MSDDYIDYRPGQTPNDAIEGLIAEREAVAEAKARLILDVINPVLAQIQRSDASPLDSARATPKRERTAQQWEIIANYGVKAESGDI